MLTIEQAVEVRRSESARVHTPWGMSDQVTHFANGITFYNTPSHGGFFLSIERMYELPAELRKTSAADLRYCGASWFEEDCEASLVVVGFPNHFTDDERANALRSIAAFYPKTYAAYMQSEHARLHDAECGQPIDAAIVAPCEKRAGHAGPCRAFSQERS